MPHEQFGQSSEITVDCMGNEWVSFGWDSEDKTERSLVADLDVAVTIEPIWRLPETASIADQARLQGCRAVSCNKGNGR